MCAAGAQSTRVVWTRLPYVSRWIVSVAQSQLRARCKWAIGLEIIPSITTRCGTVVTKPIERGVSCLSSEAGWIGYTWQEGNSEICRNEFYGSCKAQTSPPEVRSLEPWEVLPDWQFVNSSTITRPSSRPPLVGGLLLLKCLFQVSASSSQVLVRTGSCSLSLFLFFLYGFWRPLFLDSPLMVLSDPGSTDRFLPPYYSEAIPVPFLLFM